MIIKTSYPFMKPPPSARLIRGHRSARGLACYLLMNEGGGNKVFDLSGNGNIGNFVGTPSWPVGKFGHALDLDGTNDYVTVTGSIDKSYSELTAVVYAYIRSNDTSFEAIGPSCRGTGNFIMQFYSTGDRLGYSWGSEWGFSTGPIITLNKWGMFVITVSVSANKGVAYVCQDGKITSVENTGYTHTAQTLDDWKFFFDEAIAGRKLDGLVEFAMLYDRVLSASEIAELYWKSFGMFERKARTALMSGYEVVAPPVGMAGAMTTNTGYWGY